MRPVGEWTIEDLDALIRDQVPESHFIDYKRSEALSKKEGHRKDLGKDVSAFANSSGGILVYGMEEENQLPTNLDGGVTDDITREWVEQTIDGNVRPRIAGLVVKIVDAPDSRRFVVIEAPQATVHAPHMANERYYRRGNTKSEPMQDYEVRDIFRRSSSPDLYIEFHPIGRDQGRQGHAFGLEVRVGNRSSEPALYSAFRLLFDPRLSVIDPSGEWFRREEQVRDQAGNMRDVVRFEKHLSVPKHHPIYREEIRTIGNFKVTLSGMTSFPFGYEVTCPGFSIARNFEVHFTGTGSPPVAITELPTIPFSG